jgi:bacteriocin-like protein
MNLLSNEELKNISGGGITLITGMLITSGIIFLIGVIDGFVRPLKCNR